MKSSLENLFKSSFIKNVIMVASGTAGAQMIALLTSPLITRLYGPDAFGIMGTFQAMIKLFIPIAALTYPIAIVLPKKDQDAKGLIKLSLIISGIFSLILFIFIIIFNQPITRIFNLESVAGYLYLIPIVVIFAALMQSAEQWIIRIKQFSFSAKATFLQALINSGSKIGIGFIYPAASVLVVVTALNNGIKAFFMIIFLRRFNYKIESVAREETKGLKKLSKEYYDFPTYRTPQELINAITNGVPTLMLTAFFGPASAGFYTIGRTALRLPSQLIGKSVGDVFYPRVTEAVNNNENISKMLKKATLGLSGVGIIPFGVVILFGPILFSFVFGEGWVVAGEYARWIALWSFSSFINRACVRSLPVLNAQRFHLIYTMLTFFIRTVALAIGYYIFNSDVVSISLFGITGALFNFGLIYFTIRLGKKKALKL